MTFCDRCQADVEAHREEPSGILMCTGCGAILDESAWSAEPTFNKEGGTTTVAGHFVSVAAGSQGLGRIANGRLYGQTYDSQERASMKARSEIERLVDTLRIQPREDTVSSAQRLYLLANQYSFTRGRRVSHVAAASIYIICRQQNLPYMLLDFTDILQVNVFDLGAVFLQLCKLLRLEDHDIMTRPVDPSLYLHRFAARLQFGRQLHQVVGTALRLISSMKRDWLQTGRRPAGVCGAALYIAGHVHGFQLNRQDVVRVVHVGESTLAKRVDEFALTDASQLNVEEFEEHSKVMELEQEGAIELLESGPTLALPAGFGQSGCQHISDTVPVFASGMCKDCYIHFVQATGGMSSRGADPPAYTRGRQKADALALEGPEEEERPALPAYAREGAEELALDFAAELDQKNGEEASALQLHRKGSAGKGSRGKRKAANASSGRHRKQRKTGADSEEDGEAGEHSTDPGDEIAAAEPSTADGEEEETSAQAAIEAEAREPHNAGAIVPYDNGTVDSDLEDRPSKWQPEVKETLSDIEDEEMTELLCTPAEVRRKEAFWTSENQDYIDKMALKAATMPPKATAEEKTRRRSSSGRPKGSRSKAKPEEDLTPSATPIEGIKKVLTAKNLSNKINYANLDSLFEGSRPTTASPLQAAKREWVGEANSKGQGGVATPRSSNKGSSKLNKLSA